VSCSKCELEQLIIESLFDIVEEEQIDTYARLQALEQLDRIAQRMRCCKQAPTISGSQWVPLQSDGCCS
jgi:hypothetical protein